MAYKTCQMLHLQGLAKIVILKYSKNMKNLNQKKQKKSYINLIFFI
jgi:hypothetical protein